MAPRAHLAPALGAAAALLFVPLAVPLVTGRVFPLDDLAALHLPMRHVYQQALQAGESFLWTPSIGAGVYLHAVGEAGMAHPLHLALYWTLPLAVAFNLEILASYLLALGGMFLLLTRTGLARAPALFGGIVFAFSGFNLLHFPHVNLVAIVAHIPWLLWAADLALSGETARRRAGGFAALAATIGSQILLGFPQSVSFGLIALAWFAVLRATSDAPWRRVPLLALGLVAGVLIGGVQLLPTLDLFRESFRTNTTEAFRVSFSLHPLNLVQLFSPYTFADRIYTPETAERVVHELGIYDGALSILSVAWVLSRWRAIRHRRLAVGWMCLAALGFVLALGRYGGLYPLLSQLPGLSGFRAPARYVVLVHLAFAGLAAIVLADLIEIARRQIRVAWFALWPLAVPVAISAAAVAAVAALARGEPAAALPLRWPGAAVGTVPLVLTALLMALAARRVGAALPLLVILSAVDLGTWGLTYVWSQRPTPVAALQPQTGLPPGAQGDLIHPYNRNTQVNLPVLFGYRSTRAYLGLYGEPALSLYDPQTWRLLGVRWAWARDEWIPLDETMPYVRLVSRWIVAANPGEEIRGIDITETALVDAPPGVTSGPPGSVTVSQRGPGRLALQTVAPAPQVLVVAERFHHGWTASIDGVPVPVRRAYGDLLGCLVPAGTHVVSWRFAPASATWGLRLTLAGLALTLLSAALLARPWRRTIRA